jgi:2-dehydro-3-deoxyphosphogluconate aldolase/(4S)-4-hydroxy-2-oxoglutarate aldolase
MKLIELADHGPVIPVITLQRVADAEPMARALLDGGVQVLEMTLRTSVALQAIREITRALPEAIVGAGTLRSAADAHAAHAAGCRFGVSPGFSRELSRACADIGLPLLPGVALLKAWAGPFAEARFCPTGGITPQSAVQYLALPNVPVCGGSWLTPQDAVDAGDWPRITALARAASQLRAAPAARAAGPGP